MSFKKKTDLTSDVTVKLGGTDPKTGKPNPKSLEGYFLGTKEVKSVHGDAKVHVFRTATGNVSLFGKANSNRLLTSDLVGQMVRLTFTGMSKPQPGKAAAYKFELEHDEENVLDSSTVESLVTSSDEDYETDHESIGAEDEYEEETEELPVSVTAVRQKLTTPSAEAQARVRNLLGRK